MGKKYLLSLILSCLLVSFLTALETVYTFEPLKPNERLAYQMSGEKGWLLSLYVQDMQTFDVIRFINAWDNSTQWGMLQFANNRKECFFVIRNREAKIASLFKVNGNKGVVVKLFDNIAIKSFIAYTVT